MIFEENKLIATDMKELFPIKIAGKQPAGNQPAYAEVYEPSVTGHTDEFDEHELMDLDQDETHKRHEEHIKDLIKKEPKLRGEI